jgi:hypothetical protein
MNQPDRTIRLYHPLSGTGASSRAARKAGGARVSALPYLYRPLGKRSFGTNPDGEAKGASPRGGLVGCNKRWYGAEDGRRFLARRGDRARALGWTSRDLFGLLTVPEHAKPSFNRLSRYDETGLIWLLEGRKVLALTEATASIRNPNTGNLTVYRCHNKPALGPVGDSLDDLDPPFGGSAA